MSEENYTPEILHAAFKHAHQGSQYWKFLHDMLEEIPLISLWDSCILYARTICKEGSVPDCIKGIDLETLYNEEVEPDQEILKPIQEWLSDELAKSIERGEIASKLTGRFLDGKIDVKRTYIDFYEIDNWLLSRSINISDDYSGEYLNYEHLDAINIIHNAALAASQFLIAKAYNPSFEFSTVDSRENDHLLFENARLRRQVDHLSSRSINHMKNQKTAHGNAERFARNREQILGAALHVITQWIDQCQNTSGKFEATKIAALIDSKSTLFWPNNDAPPLSLKEMERLIGKWLKGDVD